GDDVITITIHAEGGGKAHQVVEPASHHAAGHCAADSSAPMTGEVVFDPVTLACTKAWTLLRADFAPGVLPDGLTRPPRACRHARSRALQSSTSGNLSHAVSRLPARRVAEPARNRDGRRRAG